jgi:RNA polymerase sigma factor (TIGR02999 family)
MGISFGGVHREGGAGRPHPLAAFGWTCETRAALTPRKRGEGRAMTAGEPDNLTRLLAEAGRGDAEARSRAWNAVYAELRGLAAGLMARERAGHTLQPTALVHEAYARLAGADLGAKGRSYFFAAAASAMRRILIEGARRRAQPRSPGGSAAFDLDQLTMGDDATSAEALDALEAALDALARHDPLAHEVVMLRFFAGLSVPQTAEVAGVSPRSVDRRWQYGRAWLFARMGRPQPSTP